MRTTQPFQAGAFQARAFQAPDDGGAPVWTRARRKRGAPVTGFIGAVLILFALLLIVLTAVNGGSFARGGAQVDRWFASVVNTVAGAKSKAVAMDQAPPVEPASAPASSQPAASSAPAPAPAPAPSSAAATAPAAKP